MDNRTSWERYVANRLQAEPDPVSRLERVCLTVSVVVAFLFWSGAGAVLWVAAVRWHRSL